MLDIETLRIVQAVLGATAFVLIFFGTYRTTRSPYAGWWSSVVALAGTGAILYLLATDSTRGAMGAIGNGLGAASAVGITGAARALRGVQTRVWVVAGVAVVVSAASLLERPSGAGWPGGLAVPATMVVLGVIACTALWGLARSLPVVGGQLVGADARGAIVAVACAITAMSVFYLARLIAYITVGPDSQVYQTWLGPTATTLGACVAMLVVTYSVALLSRYEVAEGWKVRAIHDDLTGLLHRDEFRDRVERELADAAGPDSVLMLADFDHFKQLNDEHGHAMGDRALVAFGDTCRAVLADDDVAGRWGGEEFVLYLSRGGVERAERVADALSAGVRRVWRQGDAPPTLSYGIAHDSEVVAFDELLARADSALYQAKDEGRNRKVVHGQEIGPQ